MKIILNIQVMNNLKSQENVSILMTSRKTSRSEADSNILFAQIC